MPRYIVGVLLFLQLILPAAVCADQEEEPPGTIEMKEVVVTASRFSEEISDVPVSITVVSEDEILDRHALALEDVLEGVAGIHLFRQGSLGEESGIRLRGAAFNQVLVLIDGIKANSPLTGEFDFGDVLAEQVGRVEIVRGGQSALYGSEAMGGVVNIISGRGAGPPRGSLLVEGGSRGTLHSSISTAGETDRVRYALAVSRTDANTRSDRDSFSANAANANIEIDLSDSTRLQLTSRYLGSDKDLGIFFSWPANPEIPELPSMEGPLTFRRDPNRELERERFFSTIGLTRDLYDWWTLDVRGGLVLDDLHEKNDVDPDAAYVTMMERVNIDARRIVAVVQNRFTICNLDTVVAGVEVSEERLALDEYGNIDSVGYFPPVFSMLNRRRENSALFIQNAFHWRDRLLASAGIRLDHSSDYGNNISPKGAVAVHIHETGTLIRAGVGTGFRAPTFSELHTPGFGNPDLEPEESVSYEAGLEQGLFDGRVRLGATFFHIEYDELIGVNPDFNPATDPRYLINVGEAFARGLEAEIHILPVERLDLGAAYTYLETEDRDTGEELPGRPRHQAHFSAAYRRGPIRARVDAHIVDEHADDLDYVNIYGQRSTGRQAGYSSIDVACSYTFRESWHCFDGITPHIRLSNLLDEDYEEVGGYPAPGFSALFGVRADF